MLLNVNSLIHYFTHHHTSRSLYNKEKTKTLVIACLITILSMIVAFVIHILDEKPKIVLLTDLLFFTSAFVALYFVKLEKAVIAANVYLLFLMVLVITQNIFTDYLYGHDLNYYHILETTLLFTLTLFTVAFFMQERYQLICTILLGFCSIITHYYIIISKTVSQPSGTHALSILISYLVIFAILSIIADRMLYTFTSLIRKAEDESLKVKMYNTELESMISERTQALEIQNEELKKVNAELDRFVYSASHDLRAPLASILGLIQLARLEKDTDKVKEYLAMKERSIMKLDSFIQDIVHVSKNARTEIRQDEINFQVLIGHAFDQLDYLDNICRVKKQVEIYQDTPFYSDEPRITIILSNLISNAISYAAPHRREAFVRIQVNVEQGMAILEVEDNGLGIAEDHLDKVFNMFFRANYDSTGSGLGLYIVKETLDKLCGDINVMSTLGKGSIFTVKIPNEVPCHSLSTIPND